MGQILQKSTVFRLRQGLNKVARKAAGIWPARCGGDFRSHRKPAGPVFRQTRTTCESPAAAPPKNNPNQNSAKIEIKPVMAQDHAQIRPRDGIGQSALTQAINPETDRVFAMPLPCIGCKKGYSGMKEATMGKESIDIAAPQQSEENLKCSV